MRPAMQNTEAKAKSELGINKIGMQLVCLEDFLATAHLVLNENTPYMSNVLASERSMRISHLLCLQQHEAAC